MKDYFNIKATGKNIELGSFFQKYNLKKLSSVFLKYSANPISANTVLEKRNVFFEEKRSRSEEYFWFFVWIRQEKILPSSFLN